LNAEMSGSAAEPRFKTAIAIQGRIASTVLLPSELVLLITSFVVLGQQLQQRLSVRCSDEIGVRPDAQEVERCFDEHCCRENGARMMPTATQH
jgi:hypothetical protein